MLGFFKRKSANSFAPTYTEKTVSHNEQDYTVRELSIGERNFFLGEVVDGSSENVENMLLAMAWLIQTACKQFEGEKLENIANFVAPSAQDALATAILELSGLNTEAVEQHEKKS